MIFLQKYRLFLYLTHILFSVLIVLDLSCGFGGIPEVNGTEFILRWGEHITIVSKPVYIAINSLFKVMVIMWGLSLIGAIGLFINYGIELPLSINISEDIWLFRKTIEKYTQVEVIFLWASRMLAALAVFCIIKQAIRLVG